MNGKTKLTAAWAAVVLTVLVLFSGIVYGYATLNHRVGTQERQFSRVERNQQKMLADLNRIKGRLGIED